MNIAFIGAGQVFHLYAATWARYAPVDSMFYLVDPNEEAIKLAETRFQPLCQASFDFAVAVADFVVIGTPSYIRRAVCEPFIERGIPIAVEKPLAINWDEIDWFEANADKWICPIVQARHLSKIRNMKRRFPDFHDCKAWKNRERDAAYYSGWHGKFATDGGVLAQQGFHCLDLACWFGGPVDTVQAWGAKLKHAIECEDTAQVALAFANGKTGYVQCTTAGPEGSAGLSLWDSVDNQLAGTEAPGFQNGVSGHARLAKAVYKALAEGGSPPATVGSMIPSLRTLHACYVSMDRNGERVEVGARHPRLGVPV